MKLNEKIKKYRKIFDLSQEQLEKKGNKMIEGEALDLLVGNRPLPETEKTELINRFRREFKTYFSYEYCLTYFLQMMLFA